MSTERRYYVYAHVKPNGEVFYVGKGSGKRSIQTGNRSEFWKRVVRKYGFVPKILFDNLTEEEAFDREIETIARYKAQGLCEVNVSLGGDGVRVATRWWNKAISESLTGMRRPKGRASKSYKDVLSKGRLQELYVHQGLASPVIARMFGVSIPTITARLTEYAIPVRRPGRAAAKVRCLNDGRIFGSMSEAARFYGLFRENIRKVLRGKYAHTGNRRFVLCNDLTQSPS